ncbi:hypothetical protein P879_01275 [Paragonimus westermani]|uniref:Uncharacterized protein n=1 Tax=Paragonimus westermani TaxID=34504 RepID=A0A8T0DWP8_9TREM|nr:hypothetical protein P879_01275 [Paragonimus westermani]
MWGPNLKTIKLEISTEMLVVEHNCQRKDSRCGWFVTYSFILPNKYSRITDKDAPAADSGLSTKARGSRWYTDCTQSYANIVSDFSEK